MANPHYLLSWDMYSKNFCAGIVDMQQNGDLVDMTIAADGHLVKVHKMVMCLASPYIKKLISTAPCSHPVIFLNKVSHHTLCLLLEYIYTGTVQVPQNQLQEMIEAGRELHIKGLMDNMDPSATHDKAYDDIVSVTPKSYSDKLQSPLSKHVKMQVELTSTQKMCSEDSNGADIDTFKNIEMLEEEFDDDDQTINCNDSELDKQQKPVLQYTISNQGKLQLILNRFMYRLIWVYTNPRDKGIRRWICVENDKRTLKCTALVFSRDGIVCKRRGIHNHPFHDRRIMRKIQKGAVYTAIQQAEEAVVTAINNKNVDCFFLYLFHLQGGANRLDQIVVK